MKSVWRELEAREIILRPGNRKVAPGEAIDLHFSTERKGDILLRFEIPDGVSSEKNEFFIRNGSAIVSMTPMIPGNFNITISYLTGPAPLYYFKNGHKVFIFTGERIEVGQIEAIW